MGVRALEKLAMGWISTGAWDRRKQIPANTFPEHLENQNCQSG